MNWIILIFAGFFEVGFVFCLGKARESNGMELYAWIAGFLVSAALSFTLLLRATQTLPMSSAYAVWTGIGAFGTVIVGIIVFKDPVNFWRIFFIATLICSVIGLKTVSH